MKSVSVPKTILTLIVCAVMIGVLTTTTVYTKNIEPYLKEVARIDLQKFTTQDDDDTEDDLSKTPPGQIAIRDALLAKLDKDNKESIFSVIDAIENDPSLIHNCHELAHDIGHRAYELYGFSGSMNFSDVSRLNHASVQDICAGGYIHGILEEASVHLSTFTDNPGNLCEKVSSINRASCYHGIGHALMFAFDRDVEDSLIGCRTIQNSYDASRCFEGVWMERFWGKSTADDETITQDPLALCIATKKDSKPACFLYASFGYLRTHVKDYKGAIRFCTQNNLEHSDSEFCLKGVGITMNSAFKSKNLNATEPYVANLDYWKKKAFYQGVFGYASLAGISEKSLEDMCAAFKKDGELCREVIMESN